MPTSTLTALLRERTRVPHARAEHAPFMAALLSGERRREDWAALLGQLWYVYDALERTGRALVGHPQAGRFVDRRLERLPAIEDDLTYLAGPRWRENARALGATTRYTQAIEATAAVPAAYVAQHWVRYLGDLSGGQLIRVLVGQHQGLDRDGLAFTRFDLVGEPRRYRDEYHHRLDTTAWTPVEREVLLETAVAGFEHNRAILVELDETVP